MRSDPPPPVQPRGRVPREPGPSAATRAVFAAFEHTGLALLRRVDALGYRAFLIEEVCGFPFDCRNVLCLPAERQADFANSPVLDALVASRRLFAVTAYVENQGPLSTTWPSNRSSRG